MVDRQEVERWLSACTVAGYDAPDGDNSHVSFEVPAPTLAALCRAWLALDEAPAQDVIEAFVGGRVGMVRKVFIDAEHIGQRVRIVKEAREK